MFKVGADPKQPNAIIFGVRNEPTFKVPYLFNYVGRQDCSVFQAREIANEITIQVSSAFRDTTMLTWLLWNMIGLYPIIQTTFLIHSPWSESMTIDLGTGKRLKVTSIGGDGNGDIKSIRSKP
ncbi:uncharacterized protein RSE6_04506 [Rhynchosporium secalis]|uniref:Glycosyl hydrolase family 92 domain-containing protein n=1 Tax=Rhynchosporium secalis TaxID=38038 RepID=A0A1E1M5J2_RHYSE|nr:uncharacterized protein RSE6_04506 [Rhynchosporium secalis]